MPRISDLIIPRGETAIALRADDQQLRDAAAVQPISVTQEGWRSAKGLDMAQRQRYLQALLDGPSASVNEPVTPTPEFNTLDEACRKAAAQMRGIPAIENTGGLPPGHHWRYRWKPGLLPCPCYHP